MVTVYDSCASKVCQYVGSAPAPSGWCLFVGSDQACSVDPPNVTFRPCPRVDGSSDSISSSSDGDGGGGGGGGGSSTIATVSASTRSSVSSALSSVSAAAARMRARLEARILAQGS